MSDTAKRIAELEKELAESINGYISRKVIKGKERFYLQWTENGKLKSRYIKAGELESLGGAPQEPPSRAEKTQSDTRRCQKL